MPDPRPSRPVSRLITAQSPSLTADDLANLGVFEGAASDADLEDRLRSQVESEVAAIGALVDGCDAFDVIELLRLREFVPSLELSQEPDYDGNSNVIELITLVLLSRGDRRPASAIAEDDARPHEQVPELHDRAKRLIRLAQLRIILGPSFSDRAVLAQLAASYKSFFVGVRSHQFTSIEDAHDAALFDRPDSDDLLTAKLGFTYRDYITVRNATSDMHSSVMTGLRDRTGKLVLETRAQGREPTQKELEEFQRDMIDFMFLPGRRAAFTSADIAAHAGADQAVVDRVLQAFSTDFDGTVDPVGAVTRFLHGRNPLAVANLLRSGDEHIMTTGPIGSGSFRALAEAAIKPDTKAWRRYDQKIRKTVTEQLATESIAQLVETEPVATSLEYVAPKAGEPIETVGEQCPSPLSAGDLVEADALFIVDDVAICVEVKGRTIAETARRGDLARLDREARVVLGGGAGQARRLQSLILTNAGVWRADQSWWDLSHIKEVQTVVVGLDTFGPLSVGLGDLEAASLLGEGMLPWITSLHDLEVVSRLVSRPCEFLLYLRRRTDPGVVTFYRGVDELDFLALFLDGGLFVAPDLDEVHRAHPRTPPPTAADRRRHRDDARPTEAVALTGQLDAWIYSQEGSGFEGAPRPEFNSHPAADELVDLLAREGAPGWFRFGSDLLGLAGDAQQKLGEGIDTMVDQTRTAGGFHTLSLGYAGLFGYPTLFAACRSDDISDDDAAQRLATYMEAKKHQLLSDRSMGFLFDPHRRVVASIYMNHAPTDDPCLDQLGLTLGLQRTWRQRPKPNPEKKAKRQRSKARKRKRRR